LPTTLDEPQKLDEKLAKLLVPTSDLEEGLLVSATYDGEKKVAVLKFYDPKRDRIWRWEDNTGHRPYCVEGDTILLGDNKTIAEICEGSEVLGLSGEVAIHGKVVRPYEGNMTRVSASGLLPFNITPEHPVLVAKSMSSGHGTLTEFGAPQWKNPMDLQPKTGGEDGDYLVFPIAKPRYSTTSLSLAKFSRMRSGWLKASEFPVDVNTAWLLGLYVAEGSCGGRRGAVFSLSANEEVIMDRIRSIARDIGYSSYRVKNGKNSVRVHLGGAVVARAMEDWCGHGASKKKIPDFVLFHADLQILRSFLEGYNAGDGSKQFTENTKAEHEVQTMVSVSRLLVLQLQQAYARLGTFASISVLHHAGEHSIEGRVVHQRGAYQVRFLSNPKYTRARKVRDLFYTPVTKIEQVGFSGSVYNIQTSDNTYLVNNAVVHNCYTKLPASELRSIRSRSDIVSIEDVERLDLLSDSTVTVRKITATDPLAIGGGAPGKSIRDDIRAWEADIKYYENYVYDRNLRVGTYYTIRGGMISPLEKEIPELVARSLEQILAKNIGEQARFIREWAELLSQPLCTFKRIALDIEVANEEARIPDPEKADREVIAVSFHNDAESLVYLVAREGDVSLDGAKTAYTPMVFADEASMIREAFSKIMDYPFLITFNGDDFDLRYLVHRAERLGIKPEEIPIYLMRQEASLRHGVHIDLYRFFNNRSIQVYVYSNRYTEHTLNGISEAVLGKSKIEFEGNVGDLPLLELANYCLNDSQLTYELTSLNSSLMMKILLVISRIGKMPMNDVARLGVSNWIRSMLFYEHRRMGAIIPRQDELAQKGGASSEAIIKGKKYKGGLVIEPTPGVHFEVSVLDFASLYPSIIKVYNLSYETVNCPHEECRSNKVPDTDHWVCRKRSGIESLVTGSLRDLRVGHYKHLAKDKSLTQEERELYGVVSQGLKVILNACFTPDTYIVTPQGIKNIRDVKVGDRVVNVNPDTLATEIDTVVEVQQFPYKGELYHFNDRRFVDLAVTPNHRMLVQDKKARPNTHATFLTAEEVFERTNVAIPKLSGGIKDSPSSERISLLETARELDALANIYPPRGERLSNWFRRLPSNLRETIKEFASVNKNRSKIDPLIRSHYRLRSSRITENDVDVIEQAGGFVLLGTPRYSKIPVRYDAEDFASLCGWFVSEGNLTSTEPRYYASGRHRGRSSGIVITQSFGNGNSMGVPYRAEIKRVITRLGLRPRSDSRDKKYYRVSNNILHSWMLTNCYSSEVHEHHSGSKRVPGFVFSSRRLMESFFASCYKGDGSTRDRKYSTTSLQLAKEMVVLQSLLGAKTKLVYDQKERIYRVVFKNVSSKLTYAGDHKDRYVKKIPYEGTVYCVTTARNHTVLAGRNGRFVPVGQSYGVMGFETFALYCLPVAEATAAYGRYAITKTIEKCKQEGISVIYSDTDSLFVENPNKAKIEELTRWAEHDLGVELDVDKSYRYVAFSERKKNYFGVLQDGTADIKGLTGKKSQTPEFLKKAFYECLTILGTVYAPADFERARRETKTLLTKMVSSLRNKEISLEDLSFNVMIGKAISGYSGTTPQHVRAAQLLRDRGREIKAGDIISFVKTKTPPNVKPVSLARVDEVDVDKYLEYASSMFDQMLDSLGFSFDEILGSTTLDAFWS
jgi:DNA polymerase elongation subunit (family B)